MNEQARHSQTPHIMIQLPPISQHINSGSRYGNEQRLGIGESKVYFIPNNCNGI